jgi:hypothetical protein
MLPILTFLCNRLILTCGTADVQVRCDQADGCASKRQKRHKEKGNASAVSCVQQEGR